MLLIMFVIVIQLQVSSFKTAIVTIIKYFFKREVQWKLKINIAKRLENMSGKYFINREFSFDQFFEQL